MANSQDERGPMPQVFRSVGGTGPPRKVLAYGDSLTAGFYHFGRRFAPYGAALAEALGQTGVAVEVWVCGLSGLTVADFVRDIQQDSVTCVCGRTGEGLAHILHTRGPFDLVLIMGGTNDLANASVTPQRIAANLQKLHTTCHDVGTCSVVLSVPPNANVVQQGSKSEAYVRRWQSVNSLMHEWATAGGAGGDGRVGVLLHVDVESIVPYVRGAPEWEVDGLHLSAEGSTVLGNALEPLVRPILEANEPRSCVSLARWRSCAKPSSDGSQWCLCCRRRRERH